MQTGVVRRWRHLRVWAERQQWIDQWQRFWQTTWPTTWLTMAWDTKTINTKLSTRIVPSCIRPSVWLPRVVRVHRTASSVQRPARDPPAASKHVRKMLVVFFSFFDVRWHQHSWWRDYCIVFYSHFYSYLHIFYSVAVCQLIIEDFDWLIDCK